MTVIVISNESAALLRILHEATVRATPTGPSSPLEVVVADLTASDTSLKHAQSTVLVKPWSDRLVKIEDIRANLVDLEGLLAPYSKAELMLGSMSRVTPLQEAKGHRKPTRRERKARRARAAQGHRKAARGWS